MVGSTAEAGWRGQLASRYFEKAGAFSGLDLAERGAFQAGYMAATRDMLRSVGTVIAFLSFVGVCFAPALYMPVRRALRPWTLRHVASGRWLVAYVQRFQNPFLDRLHSLCALSCGIEFYITFLPLLFWVGEVRLARLTTIFMAMTIYVGNAIKDTVCAPRPAPGVSGTPPHGPHVVRVLKTQSEGKDAEDNDHEQEYGLPSTHTIQTLCLAFYLLHWCNHNQASLSILTHGADRPGGGDPTFRWLFDSLFASSGDAHGGVQLAFLLAVGWSLFIVWGRLYLGMHSPVDIGAGAVVAAACLAFFIPIEDFVDAWITSGNGYLPAYQLAFDLALIFTYPRPERRTPSYNYALYVRSPLAMTSDFSVFYLLPPSLPHSLTPSLPHSLTPSLTPPLLVATHQVLQRRLPRHRDGLLALPPAGALPHARGVRRAGGGARPAALRVGAVVDGAALRGGAGGGRGMYDRREGARAARGAARREGRAAAEVRVAARAGRRLRERRPHGARARGGGGAARRGRRGGGGGGGAHRRDTELPRRRALRHVQRGGFRRRGAGLPRLRPPRPRLMTDDWRMMTDREAAGGTAARCDVWATAGGWVTDD
jgi:membrane-associated phospholipid phosphatase